MINRPSWDDYFTAIAETVATRSTCSKRSVGAVFVSADNHILSTGYNGAPSHERHCEHFTRQVLTTGGYYQNDTNENGKCSVVVHAELNAVLAAAKKGVSLEGSRLFVTYPPCEECSKFLKQLGLERIACPEKIT